MTTTTHAFTVLRAEASAESSGPTLPPLRHFINGEFVSGEPVSWTRLVSPVDDRVIAEVPDGGAEDVDQAVAAARRALRTWRETTPKERADLLLQIAARMEDSRDELIGLEMLNAGKPLVVAADDVDMAVDNFRFAAGACRAFTEMGSADYVADSTTIMIREPVGVVGVVVPWNYPLLMAAWKIGPLLAAGNAVVLKPAEQTPLTVLKLLELVEDLLPAGLLNIVLGLGPQVGERLATHEDIDLVALTGSVGSGRSVARGASDSLKRVHLELGGKAPVVVYPDADLDAASEAVREAGFWNSGQECGAATRVLVHESVAERFIEMLAEKVSSIVIGDPVAGEEVELGPLVSGAHLERVIDFIDAAVGEGARAVIGGHSMEGPGCFVAPTVLTDVQPGSEAARLESFGPVVTVETFAEEQEAVHRANDVQYGLAASVWTRDMARGMTVPRQLDFGTVWVNSHLVLASEVPWGGFKGSGYGRDLSVYALSDFSRTKHVQVNHAR